MRTLLKKQLSLVLALSGAAGIAGGVWSTAAFTNDSATSLTLAFDYEKAEKASELSPTEIENNNYPAIYAMYENLWHHIMNERAAWKRMNGSGTVVEEKEWLQGFAPAIALGKESAFYLDSQRGSNGMLESNSNIVRTSAGINNWNEKSSWEKTRGDSSDKPGQNMSLEARSLTTAVNVAVATDPEFVLITRTSAFPDYLLDGKTPSLLSKMISSRSDAYPVAKQDGEQTDFTYIKKIADIVKVYPGPDISNEPISLGEAIPIFEYLLRQGKRFDILGGLYNLRSMILNSIQRTYLMSLKSPDKAEKVKSGLFDPLTLSSPGSYDPLGYGALDKYAVIALIQCFNDAFDFAVRNISVSLGRAIENYTVGYPSVALPEMVGFSNDQKVADGVETLVQEMKENRDLETFAKGPALLYGCELYTAVTTYLIEAVGEFRERANGHADQFKPFHKMPEKIEDFPGPGGMYPFTKVQLEEMKGWMGNNFFTPDDLYTIKSKTSLLARELNKLIHIGASKSYGAGARAMFDYYAYFDAKKFWKTTKGACESTVWVGNVVKFYARDWNRYEGGCPDPFHDQQEYNDYMEDHLAMPPANQFSHLLGYLESIDGAVGKGEKYNDTADYEKYVIPVLTYAAGSASFALETTPEWALSLTKLAMSTWGGVISSIASSLVSLFFEFFKPSESFTNVYSRQVGSVVFKRFGETKITRKFLGMQVYENTVAVFKTGELLKPITLYDSFDILRDTYFFPSIKDTAKIDDAANVAKRYSELMNAMYVLKTSGIS